MARIRLTAAEILTEKQPSAIIRFLTVGTAVGAPLGVLTWLVYQDPGTLNWIITRTLWALGQH